jgi:hypothetical protein
MQLTFTSSVLRFAFLKKKKRALGCQDIYLFCMHEKICHIAGHYGRNMLAKFKQEFASCLIYYGWKI